MRSNSGKTAIVTGASSGIGKASAEALARAGFTVFGTSRRPSNGYNGVTMVPCDVTDDASVKALVSTVLSQTGRIDVVAKVREITGQGVRYSLEASAQPTALREAVHALMPGGTCVLLGSARAGTEVSLEMPFLQFGRTVRGVIQGESHPQEFIPQLVDFLMQGQMPVERMISFYPLADINRAAQDSNSGATIKPVLRMPH